MGKTQAHSIRRGLSIYKQPQGTGRGSPNWYARVYMRIGDRMLHVRSTGTSDIRQAKIQAENYWADCLIASRGGGSSSSSFKAPKINDGRFDLVAKRWLAGRKIDAGDDPRRLRACKDDEADYFAANGLGAFFGQMDVNAITTDTIRDFLRFKVEKSQKATLADSTLKRTLVTLSCILKSAFERRILTAMPLMPKVRVKDNPRPYFTRAEYDLLIDTAWRQAKQARERGDQAEYDHWMEMSDFVVFMVSTFLRPSEWAAIRHRDVTIVYEGPTPHIHIKNVRGKTGPRDVHSMPVGVAAYRHIAERTGGIPDGFLFKVKSLNRQTAVERMRDSFERLLRAAGLYRVDGRNLVSYSLRHSAIMFRLLEGDHVDLLVLAKAAGTSVDQIERFYGSHLEVGMKLENLQSIRHYP